MSNCNRWMYYIVECISKSDKKKEVPYQWMIVILVGRETCIMYVRSEDMSRVLKFCMDLRVGGGAVLACPRIKQQVAGQPVVLTADLVIDFEVPAPVGPCLGLRPNPGHFSIFEMEKDLTVSSACLFLLLLAGMVA